MHVWNWNSKVLFRDCFFGNIGVHLAPDLSLGYMSDDIGCRSWQFAHLPFRLTDSLSSRQNWILVIAVIMFTISFT